MPIGWARAIDLIVNARQTLSQIESTAVELSIVPLYYN